MELLEEIFEIDMDQYYIKKFVTINHLPKLCDSIDKVLSDEKDKGIIYCVWGQHEIKRELLDHGVVFYFPQCPNALTLSVTTDNKQKISIRCTTNTKIKDEDFIDSIQTFMADWVSGIKSLIYKSETPIY